MDFDEKYLDELLKAVEPITGPMGDEPAEESKPDDSVPDMAEEELDSDVAEPLEMDESVEELLASSQSSETEAEPAAEEAAPEELTAEPEPEPVAEPEPAAEPEAPAAAGLTIDDLDPADGNKTLSADEIAALFNSANGDAPAPAAEEPEPEVTEDAPEETPEPMEIDLDSPELSDLISEIGEDGADAPEESAEPAEEMEIDLGDISLDSLLAESTEADAEAGDEPSLSDLLAETSDAGDTAPIESEQEIDLDMSEDEIDAMLNAAKNAASEPEEGAADTDNPDELMSLLASVGDEDLGDIQSLLDSDEKGEAVDEAALLAATTVEDVAANVLETPEEAAARAKEEKKAAKQKAKEDKKAAKAAKKAGKKGEAAEGEEGAAEGEAVKEKGFFAKLLSALTENLDDEIEEEAKKAEGAEGEEGGEIANISDENKEIMEELDKEQGKKKGKKPKKEKKKKKKGKGEAGEGEEGAEEGGAEDGEEGEDSGKKKKKVKKKKEKAPKAEEVPSKPEKKLPKKRVRATFLLCFSIMAGIIILSIVMTKHNNLTEARYAYDRQDYQTTYEDLYGLELKEEDEEIFVKSQIMLMIDRKLQSYQNYKKLGMEEQALDALLAGVEMYPDVLRQAESYGVVPQVDYTYSQIKDALATYGLSEDDAKEINAYESKVKYTKRIDSIVHGTPFTYDEDIAAEGGVSADSADQATEAPAQIVDDILPPETDFLPDDPGRIFNDDTQAAPAPEEGEPAEGATDIPVDEGNV